MRLFLALVRFERRTRIRADTWCASQSMIQVPFKPIYFLCTSAMKCLISVQVLFLVCFLCTISIFLYNRCSVVRSTGRHVTELGCSAGSNPQSCIQLLPRQTGLRTRKLRWSVHQAKIHVLQPSIKNSNAGRCTSSCGVYV
ncbi:hypothetical protein EJ05DRAFT_57650 [Pseudovirgaria hyperparasitica]|uniref:Uncharacterized protein n=1 Tax=Pseudovirgaria hyperparasitica TaxID=470096 RepID=A0A6A6W3I2_9PEZI|nr:uncharacterized protein EJ05DRAFT_57650 [Pseudovirgaria hyperparasitica]KAF2757163.1 hypothetical protein EJ05DRAFT_57650 [Pseudovirgaria hyperparasitica]